MRRSSLCGRTAGTPQASEDKIKAARRQLLFYLLCAKRISRPRTNCVARRNVGNGQISDAAHGERTTPSLFRQLLRPVNASVNRPDYDILQATFLKHLHSLNRGAAGGADLDFKLFG